MKMIGALALLGAVAVTAGCDNPNPEPAMADEPKPPATDAKDVPPALTELFKERNKLHKRQTGALLTITARWEKEPHLEPSVRVYWAIDYDGHRQPFTILTPDLSCTAAGQTTAHFWYLGPDGKPAGFMLAAEGIAGPPPPKQKEWFSVSEAGKPVTGRIEHGGSYLKRHFGQIPGPGNPPLWVQLEHAPTDRGDADLWNEGRWTMDAWTGELWSQVVDVTFE